MEGFGNDRCKTCGNVWKDFGIIDKRQVEKLEGFGNDRCKTCEKVWKDLGMMDVRLVEKFGRIWE